MTVYQIVKDAAFRPTTTQKAAAEAAALSDLRQRNLHHLIRNDGMVVIRCGQMTWNPDGDVSTIRGFVSDPAYRWVPVSEEWLEEAARMAVVDIINDHWRMVNSDSFVEAMGG